MATATLLSPREYDDQRKAIMAKTDNDADRYKHLACLMHHMLLAVLATSRDPGLTARKDAVRSQLQSWVGGMVEQPRFIWEQSRYLSGPVSVTVFDVGDGKQVYLFGDAHVSGDNLCPAAKPGAIHISDLVEKTARSRSGDFFLETWKDVKFDQHNDAFPLNALVTRFGDKMYAHKREHDERYPNFRFHYGDSRGHFFRDITLMFVDQRQTQRVLDVSMYVKPFVQKIKTHDQLVRFFNVFFFHDEWSETNSNDYQENFSKQINQVWPEFPLSPSADIDYDSPGYSKVWKQIDKLDGPHRVALTLFIRAFIDELVANVPVDRFNRFREVVKNGDATINTNMFFLTLMADLGIMIMDTYTLARMFNCISQQDSGSVTIIYAGDTHIDNYRLMLKGIYGDAQYNQLRDNHQNRCLDLAKTSPMEIESLNKRQHYDLRQYIF